MQVTIGAKCWNGQRRESLSEVMREESQEAARKFHPRTALLGFVALPITFLTVCSPRAFAASMEPDAVPAMAPALTTKILHAFDPLINLIQSLSYPIAGVMIAGGCLFIMVGNREKGMQMLQNAAIGYILVQLSPMLLKLLVGVGQSM